MNGSGNDLQYGTPKAKDGRPAPGRRFDAVPYQVGWAALALDRVPGRRRDAKAKRTPATTKPAIKLPKSITTHLELEDVDLAQLIAKAQFLLGFPFPVPITGRLSLNADATIPLGKLKSIKDYAFHGDLVLTKASVYKVDLGRVSARVDLADGVLELKDLRGPTRRPPRRRPRQPAEGRHRGDVPATGPLPPGAFRGTLRAAFSPPGKLTAQVRGEPAPARRARRPGPAPADPALGPGDAGRPAPRPTSAPRATRPPGTSRGPPESQQITYKGAALDGVAVAVRLEERPARRPRTDRPAPRPAVAGEARPRPEAAAGVSRGRRRRRLGPRRDPRLGPRGAPSRRPSPAPSSARAEANGTLEPVRDQDRRPRAASSGSRPVPSRSAPCRSTGRPRATPWRCRVTDARPFGGRLSAEADVPLAAGQADQRVRRRSTRSTPPRLGAAIPGGSLKLTGLASGKVTFSIPSDVSALDASVKLSAPDLTVQGLPAEQVKASVRAKKGRSATRSRPTASAASIRFKGDFPLGAAPTRHAGRRRAEGRRVHARPGLEVARGHRGGLAAGGPGGDRRERAGDPRRPFGGPLRPRARRAARPAVGANADGRLARRPPGRRDR